ncbi:VOC family protein [Arthrobacter deserti]|uniref:VOC family protein n=1 Tax=Arthrobacter deserti TaxID=1742687 RepID=A0ABX1JJW8_9MICC|nr:VOC family protein [Arthrobacter deserti]
MSGRVVHFEIPADDTARASEFYRSAFGWTLASMPDIDYTTVETTPTDAEGTPLEPGAINGGLFQRGDNELRTPVITIDVEDIDSALEKIKALGGSTVMPKQAVMDMGFTAYFRDSEGNLLGLWQDAG